MNYKKMLNDIESLVSTDFMLDMETGLIPGNDRGFTRQEIERMVMLICKVHRISHQVHCKFCRENKYEK